MNATTHLEQIDEHRLTVGKDVLRKHKSDLGQFLTPMPIAKFMAKLLPISDDSEVRLLDPGAGIGSLSAAFLEQVEKRNQKPSRVEVSAYEIDESLHSSLRNTLSFFDNTSVLIRGGDFLEHAAELSFFSPGSFTHVIMNPPYKKIASTSPARKALRSVGIETVNLYSGFVALALMNLQPGGHLVAIIPRSFCNGPYYRPFRDFVFRESAIKHIHIFDSRNHAFKEDEVLQENIIVLLQKHGKQSEITITSSDDADFEDVKTKKFNFNEVVKDGDTERFIYIPASDDAAPVTLPACATKTLEQIGLGICTGPVVDFRLRDSLLKEEEDGAVPLLYPGHFEGFETRWPKRDFKKWNYIRVNDETRKWLMPNGNYAVVRRFSAKEERRRVYAGVIHSEVLGDTSQIGIENHINVFHQLKKGLPKTVALGLATYLNTTAVDQYFRLFNGHTQVNATDLRRLKYPPIVILEKLGEWAQTNRNASQEEIDNIVDTYESV